MRSMEDEHCEIEPGDAESVVWGASDRLWTTGNYGLTTTPRKEWRWTVHLEWDGVPVEQTVGGYEKDGGWDGPWSGRENTSVRREAVAMDTLAADAPRLIFAMLHELLDGPRERAARWAALRRAARGRAASPSSSSAKRGPSGGADAVGDAGRLTEEDVRASYAKLNVNTAELLGARAR